VTLDKYGDMPDLPAWQRGIMPLGPPTPSGPNLP
jgi:hypothetical protein